MEKAKVDEGKSIGEKIDARAQRNVRVVDSIGPAHPEDKRVGSEDVAINMIGIPAKQYNPAKIKNAAIKKKESLEIAKNGQWSLKSE